MDVISREAVDNAMYDYCHSCDVNESQMENYFCDLPSAFEGMTNGEVMKAVFPDMNIQQEKLWQGEAWWDSPYKGGEQMTREEAVKILSELPDRIMAIQLPFDINYDYKEVLTMAISALSADVRPNIHGHWITDKERLGYWLSTCSECEHIFHGNELLIYKPNFCPNCGADMREPKEEKGTE